MSRPISPEIWSELLLYRSRLSEIVQGEPAIREARDLLTEIERFHKIDSPDPIEADRLLYEARGFLEGLLQGFTERPAPRPRPITPPDPTGVTAPELIGWIASLEGTGGGRRSEAARRAAGSFLRGALEVFPERGGEGPPFLGAVASRWGALATAGVSDELSERLGRESAAILEGRWRLGRSAGVPHSILNTSLHRLDLPSLIQEKGWLKGYIARARRTQTDQEVSESSSLQSALLLEKNQKTILLVAAKRGGSNYPREVALVMPEMLVRIYRLGEALQHSPDPISREAGDLLIGKPGGRRRGNVNTVVSRAIRSGQLLDSIKEVEVAFEDGRLLKGLTQQLLSLERTHPESSRILKDNRASVISRALISGQLGYPQKVAQGLPKMIETLDQTIESLEASDPKVATILKENRATVISRALNSGQLGYPQETAQGLLKMIEALDQTIKSLEATDPKVAAILKENRATVISRALSSGQLGYPQKVAQGLPKMIETLDQTIKSLEITDPKVATILKENRATVIYRALKSGQLDLVAEAKQAGGNMREWLRTRIYEGRAPNSEGGFVNIPTFEDLSHARRTLREVSEQILFDRQPSSRRVASHGALATWMIAEQVCQTYRAHGRGNFSWTDFGLNTSHSGLGLLTFIGLDHLYTRAIFGSSQGGWFVRQTILNVGLLRPRYLSFLWVLRSLVGASLAAGTISLIGQRLAGEKDPRKLLSSFFSGLLSGGVVFVLGNAAGSHLTHTALCTFMPRLALGAGGSYLSGLTGMAVGSLASRSMEKLI